MIEPEGPLSLSRQCVLLGVSRSSLYYRPKGESAENLALMRRMDELHMDYPFYGSRQMMRHLRREGATAGRHRIRRLMAVMGMEATYRRPRTSVANSEHRIFPYLLRDLEISRADHVWCADITYVPVTQGFFYLVAVMDWATRHVLSWRLSNTMDTSFCIGALDDALVRASPEILNTDQGSQFTSEAFAERVLGAGVAFSMDGRGRFLDNIFIERLWRSLKYEAVYLHELRDGGRGRTDHRLVDRLLQRGAPALGAGRIHAGRDLPQRREGAMSIPRRVQPGGVRHPQAPVRPCVRALAHAPERIPLRPLGGGTACNRPTPRAFPDRQQAPVAGRVSLPATGAYVARREGSRGLSKPVGIHLNFALGLFNEVGPLHSDAQRQNAIAPFGPIRRSPNSCFRMFPRENRSQLVELLGSDAVAVKGLAIQLGTTLDGEEISEELFGGFQFGWGCEA